jgi:hypothetical protein
MYFISYFFCVGGVAGAAAGSVLRDPGVVPGLVVPGDRPASIAWKNDALAVPNCAASASR